MSHDFHSFSYSKPNQKKRKKKERKKKRKKKKKKEKKKRKKKKKKEKKKRKKKKKKERKKKKAQQLLSGYGHLSITPPVLSKSATFLELLSFYSTGTFTNTPTLLVQYTRAHIW